MCIWETAIDSCWYVEVECNSKMMHDFKMLFLAIPAILALVPLPTPSASQGDKTTLPLTLPCQSDQQQPTSRRPPDEV